MALTFKLALPDVRAGIVSPLSQRQGAPFSPLATAFVVLLALVAWAAFGPVAQLADYHGFADQRRLLGIPRGADVVSNLGFALVAGWGLFALVPRRRALGAAWPGVCLVLLALGATCLGSGWYHLAPDDGRLVWDRLPIALACAGVLAAAATRYAGLKAREAGELTGFLGALAVASVAWWRWGPGPVHDLGPYLILQGLPLVLLPLWLWQARAAYPEKGWVMAALLCYALAKGCELADHGVFALSAGVLSGHTVKHLLATLASACLVRCFRLWSLTPGSAGRRP